MNDDKQSVENIRQGYEKLTADLNAGKPIPAVDPADFKKIWRMRDTTGEQKATAIGVIKSYGLRSMDDIPSIGFRAMLLEMLLKTGTLKPFDPDTKAEDAAISVAATFPFVFTEPKKPNATLSDAFDVGAFVKQVQERASL